MCFDLITGVVKAFKNKTYKSSLMRQGMYHKIGEILTILLATCIDYTQMYINIGFNVMILTPVCVYIILMEIGSIIENIKSINPDLISDKISQYFKGDK